MLVSDVRTLYAYNRWANARLLSAARRLPSQLLMKDLGGSYGSVFATLRHIAWGEWLWLGRWRETMANDENPIRCEDVIQLTTCWHEIEHKQSHLIATISTTDLQRLLTYENPPGTRWTYSMQHMLQHVVNHSTYHRGQVAAMLRQVGTVPPATDFLVYFDECAPDGIRS